MKRTTIAQRLEYMIDRQHELECAAVELIDTERNPQAGTGLRRHARRRLAVAALAYGLATRRYLGGRS